MQVAEGETGIEAGGEGIEEGRKGKVAKRETWGTRL